MDCYKKVPENEEEWQLLAELRSLGLNIEKLDQLNDRQELENLVENLKQTLYQEYKTHYQRH